MKTLRAGGYDVIPHAFYGSVHSPAGNKAVGG